MYKRQIRIRRVGARWWLCGDEVSDIGTGAPMVAPRVMACAGAQAMLAIRLVLGLEAVSYTHLDVYKRQLSGNQ